MMDVVILLLAILGAVVYTSFGYLLGRFALLVFYEHHQGMATPFLWPLASECGAMKDTAVEHLSPNHNAFYLFMMTFFFPVKLAWNAAWLFASFFLPKELWHAIARTVCAIVGAAFSWERQLKVLAKKLAENTDGTVRTKSPRREGEIVEMRITNAPPESLGLSDMLNVDVRQPNIWNWPVSLNGWMR